MYVKIWWIDPWYCGLKIWFITSKALSADMPHFQNLSLVLFNLYNDICFDYLHRKSIWKNSKLFSSKYFFPTISGTWCLQGIRHFFVRQINVRKEFWFVTKLFDLPKSYILNNRYCICVALSTFCQSFVDLLSTSDNLCVDLQRLQ